MESPEVRHRTSNGSAVAAQTKEAESDKSSDSVSIGEGSEVGLRRNVGLMGGMSFVVGVMIGSGIFISPKGVLEGAGSVGLALCIWVLGGILSLLGALTYAELGTMIPKSGGEHAYLMESLHPVFAFLFDYISIILLKPSTAAIICLTCSEYLLVPLFNDDCGAPPAHISKMLAIAVLLTLSAVNILSAKVANKVQIFFTLAKLLALGIIVIGGLVKLGQGNTQYISFDNTNSNLGEIAIGFYSSMWAYDGWNNLNLLTEEVKEPHKTLPRALFIGIPLVIVLYLFANISYFTVLSPEALLESNAVAISWAELVIPNFAWTIPIFVAMSTFGAANGSLFTSGRLAYVASRDKHFVKIISNVHVFNNTPSVAILFTTVLGTLMIIPSNIGSLIDLFSFAAWIFYGIVFGCCIYLRFKMPDAVRPYRVPIVFPGIAMCVAVFLVLAPIIQAPKIEFLYAFLFIFTGLIFYFPFVFYKKEIPGMSKVNAHLQLFFNVTPVDEGYVEEILKEANPGFIADKALHDKEMSFTGGDFNKVHPLELDVPAEQNNVKHEPEPDYNEAASDKADSTAM